MNEMGGEVAWIAQVLRIVALDRGVIEVYTETLAAFQYIRLYGTACISKVSQHFIRQSPCSKPIAFVHRIAIGGVEVKTTFRFIQLETVV